jgi:hypothetical protein
MLFGSINTSISAGRSFVMSVQSEPSGTPETGDESEIIIGTILADFHGVDYMTNKQVSKK